MDSLLSIDHNIAPKHLPDYELRIIPHGQEPAFEALRRLHAPGERRNKELMLKLLGTQPTTLEAYCSGAGFPVILPSTNYETGRPNSLHTVDFHVNADMEGILYDYIEDWKKRGDVTVLNDLLIFNNVPQVKTPFPLWNEFVFSPSVRTLQQSEMGSDIVYYSRIEKSCLARSWGIYTTFHVSHEVNILREILSCRLRYWLHKKEDEITSQADGKRKPQGEFYVRQERGGKPKLGGHVGFVDVNIDCKYSPWVRFDNEGNLQHPTTGAYIRDKKDNRILRCDFENTLKQLVDFMFSFDNSKMLVLSQLTYVKVK